MLNGAPWIYLAFLLLGGVGGFFLSKGTRKPCPSPPAAKYDLDSLQEASAMWEERARRHGEATANLLNALDSLQRSRPTPTQATQDAEEYLNGAPVDRLIDILEQRPE